MTCQKYLSALKALQDRHEHEKTKEAVEDFSKIDGPGPILQRKLVQWAKNKNRYVGARLLIIVVDRRRIIYSYIEESWYDSDTLHSYPVVLASNHFFVLESVLCLCLVEAWLMMLQKRPHTQSRYPAHQGRCAHCVLSRIRL